MKKMKNKYNRVTYKAKTETGRYNKQREIHFTQIYDINIIRDKGVLQHLACSCRGPVLLVNCNLVFGIPVLMRLTFVMTLKLKD